MYGGDGLESVACFGKGKANLVDVDRRYRDFVKTGKLVRLISIEPSGEGESEGGVRWAAKMVDHLCRLVHSASGGHYTVKAGPRAGIRNVSQGVAKEAVLGEFQGEAVAFRLSRSLKILFAAVGRVSNKHCKQNFVTGH
eukprot:GFKZ01009318.1.p2 GENE.GFKZ01009318.1~~GFKZ01009318.1.p2  ORF type:complete len:139 (+),score=9.88 GFKZ01009318.1:331-747(+)